MCGRMKTSTIVLVDGGFLRSTSKRAGQRYDPAFIEKFAHACISAEEECLRILYCDCAPFVGETKNPTSGTPRVFKGSAGLERDDIKPWDEFEVLHIQRSHAEAEIERGGPDHKVLEGVTMLRHPCTKMTASFRPIFKNS